MITNERHRSVVYGMSITELEKFWQSKSNPLNQCLPQSWKGKNQCYSKNLTKGYWPWRNEGSIPWEVLSSNLQQKML